MLALPRCSSFVCSIQNCTLINSEFHMENTSLAKLAGTNHFLQTYDTTLPKDFSHQITTAGTLQLLQISKCVTVNDKTFERENFWVHL